MKKQILFAGLSLFSVMNMQSPALADHDDWYKKYDNDRDGRWNYNEFSRAQRDWQFAHQQRAMSDRQLRNYYRRYDGDRDGYWTTEEARHCHNW